MKILYKKKESVARIFPIGYASKNAALIAKSSSKERGYYHEESADGSILSGRGLKKLAFLSTSQPEGI